MPYSQLLDARRITPDQVKQSQTWFTDQVSAFNKLKLTPAKILHDKRITMVTNIVPGKLYFYEYDPKLKETLPHYDRFPLVLPFSRTASQFTGLNLHYLDYDLRMKLFTQLLKVQNTRHFDDQTKIRYSWDMIKQAQKLRMAQPCVKMYLFEHLASPLGLISPQDWHTAIMLPVQRFVGSSKERVWKESRKFK